MILQNPYTELTPEHEFQGSKLVRNYYFYYPFKSLNQLFMELDKQNNSKG